MQMTFRWFGKEKDTVSLEQIKQIPNVVGVVPALHDLPAGEAWTMDRVQAMYDEITASGLTMECIESVNVHEDIKIGLPSRDKYIENYKTSIRNLSKVGVKHLQQFVIIHSIGIDFIGSDLDIYNAYRNGAVINFKIVGGFIYICVFIGNFAEIKRNVKSKERERLTVFNRSDTLSFLLTGYGMGKRVFGLSNKKPVGVSEHIFLGVLALINAADQNVALYHSITLKCLLPAVIYNAGNNCTVLSRFKIRRLS